MARDRHDSETPDLLGWKPPEVVAAYPAREIRAATLRGAVSRGVAVTLRECPLPREEIAARMTAILDEEITLNMLNAYASPAREDHAISAHRLGALFMVTGDARLLQILADPGEHSVIPSRYEAAVQEAMCVEHRERLETEMRVVDRRQGELRRRWRGGR